MPTVIELAPNWKRSLALASPLMLASGAASAGNAGAVVTRPLTMRPRAGAPLPRVIEIPGGFLMRTGAANPGLAVVVREQQRAWGASACPIVVAFAAQGVRDWRLMAARLDRVPGVGGIELQLNPTVDAVQAIRATRAATDLPILAKLDLDTALESAPACVGAGANALVVGRPPRGMAIVDGRPWYGRLYAPAVKPIVLRAIAEIAALHLDVPLVACGGVESAGDVREFLAAGAAAAELDSAAWVDPQRADRIAEELGAA